MTRYSDNNGCECNDKRECYRVQCVGSGGDDGSCGGSGGVNGCSGYDGVEVVVVVMIGRWGSRWQRRKAGLAAGKGFLERAVEAAMVLVARGG